MKNLFLLSSFLLLSLTNLVNSDKINVTSEVILVENDNLKCTENGEPCWNYSFCCSQYCSNFSDRCESCIPKGNGCFSPQKCCGNYFCMDGICINK